MSQEESFLTSLFIAASSDLKAFRVSIFFLLRLEESNLAGGLIKEFEKRAFLCEALHPPRMNRACSASNCSRLQERLDFPGQEDEGPRNCRTQFNYPIVSVTVSSFLPRFTPLLGGF